MMPIPVPPPPVQQARFLDVPLRSPADTETVRKELRPMPPPASRIDQRPVTIDRWGHLTGLGADTERIVVPEPQSDLSTPLICGILGYLLFAR
jgi:hypothetical protein